MAMQSDQEFAPTQIARAVFPTAFRGYDQDAVRRYLSRLAAALEHQQEYAGLGELEARTPAHERVEELESEVEGLRDEIKDLELELVQRSVNGDAADAESTPGAHDASDQAEDERQKDSEREDRAFDEHRAIELLGQETARVLESARSAAADILKRAETQAASLKAEAKAELEDAKRRSEALVADKQAASDELVAKLATEAEATAERITSEAEEHRTAVLDESSKILTEAEELAEAEQEGAESRAKQIVADAETLRQQVISEVVADRKQAQAEMDRMTAARDRLAMSLAVARTELDEVADALVDVADVSAGADGDPPSDDAVDAKTHAAEVEELIEGLDSAPVGDTTEVADTDGAAAGQASSAAGTPAAKGQNRKKRGKRRKGRNAAAAAQAADTAGGETAAKKSPAKKPQTGTPKPVGASFDTGGARFDELKRDAAAGDQLQIDLSEQDSAANEQPAPETVSSEPTKAASTDEAGVAGDEVVTGSALLMNDAPDADLPAEGSGAENSKAAKLSATTAKVERATVDERSEDEVPEEDVDPDEPIDLDKIIEMGLAAEAIGPDAASESVVSSDLNTPPADGEELSLVQGFTTIDLTDGDAIDLTTPESGSDGGGADGDDKELVHSVVVNERSTPEEVITTVSSRTASGQPDRTRGDLLIDEPFTGRLAKEFAARDLALTRSGPNFRRQLRRALNDDQSDVLDRLRAGRGNIDVGELPAFGEQIDRYLAPLRRGLAEIAQAGATAGGQSDLSQTALDNLVRQLARYIVDKVRVPTVEVVEATTDHDRERILEPIRSLYRDFRNVGLPDLTEDALYEAFAIGLYDSIEPSAPISWVVDPRSDPDPVCEINRQRDDVVKGVVFPSGHARPLSLPGCRCLVMLADY